ncbi:hypothetical protein QJS10_CPB12g00975 [Acorus calamus]|uniref:Uncharacterized protein n=1 Tax=Acorus calamus TaxID=4465 RepID=A0AAV9DJX7_ACOCL|nr:hypothetical protein QJS10_CPB12g00975 [Acorus calamus]
MAGGGRRGRSAEGGGGGNAGRNGGWQRVVVAAEGGRTESRMRGGGGGSDGGEGFLRDLMMLQCEEARMTKGIKHKIWANADTWFERQQQEEEMQHLKKEQQEAMQVAEDLHRKKLADQLEGEKEEETEAKNDLRAMVEAETIKQSRVSERGGRRVRGVAVAPGWRREPQQSNKYLEKAESKDVVDPEYGSTHPQQMDIEGRDDTRFQVDLSIKGMPSSCSILIHQGVPLSAIDPIITTKETT